MYIRNVLLILPVLVAAAPVASPNSLAVISPMNTKRTGVENALQLKRSEDEDAAKYGRRSEDEDAAKYSRRHGEDGDAAKYGRRSEDEDAAKYSHRSEDEDAAKYSK